MTASSQAATAGIAAGIGLLAMLALSIVVPALAHPAALAIAAAAGLGIAFRDRLRLDTPASRLALVVLAVTLGIVIWLSIQPGYIGR